VQRLVLRGGGDFETRGSRLGCLIEPPPAALLSLTPPWSRCG